MKTFAIYETQSGKIAMKVQGTEDSAQLQCDSDYDYCVVDENTNENIHFINPDTKKRNNRPETSCTSSKMTVEADGSDTVTFSNMLDGTHIEVSGPINAEMTVSGDNAEQDFTATTPGVYRFSVTAPWPAKPKEEFKIHAI